MPYFWATVGCSSSIVTTLSCMSARMNPANFLATDPSGVASGRLPAEAGDRAKLPANGAAVRRDYLETAKAAGCFLVSGSCPAPPDTFPIWVNHEDDPKALVGVAKESLRGKRRELAEVVPGLVLSCGCLLARHGETSQGRNRFSTTFGTARCRREGASTPAWTSCSRPKRSSNHMIRRGSCDGRVTERRLPPILRQHRDH